MTGTSLIPIIVVIVVVVRTGKFINKFRVSGAVNEKNAKTTEELGINKRFLFRKYLSLGIIIESNNKYYLNEQNLSNYRNRKRRILIPVLIIITVALILLDISFT